MSNIIVKDHGRDNERVCDTIAEAKETKQDMIQLGAVADQVEIITKETDVATNDVQENPPHDHHGNPVEETDGGVVETEPTDTEIVDVETSLDSDSLQLLKKNANQYTDSIKGKTVINRRGYAVLAEHFDISVEAEPITLPSETDFEYAEFKAVATTSNGQTYTGYGSAHVDRGDDETLLGELAETRAMKRSCAWSTGVGMTAASELENSL